MLDKLENWFEHKLQRLNELCGFPMIGPNWLSIGMSTYTIKPILPNLTTFHYSIEDNIRAFQFMFLVIETDLSE